MTILLGAAGGGDEGRRATMTWRAGRRRALAGTDAATRSPDPEAWMLEPQSAALFVLLIAMSGVLVWRTLAARRIAVRVLAACLAFT
ncbi:MAG TPA: hypothetical protein VFX25_38210 [Streptosporangiaceae bacterium]|nr:hypothetical protein [Streptosporangiaceae bacterium]HEX5294739.1 hypothetical protein [Streptosporangiaceae bacterium]